MKTRSIILLLIVLFSTNITIAQNNNQTEPKVNIKVTKKTDENGNLISYDSTYVKTWTNSNVSASEMDSIMQEFNSQFGNFGFNDDEFFQPLTGIKSFEDMQKQMLDEINRMHELMGIPTCKPIIPKQNKKQVKTKKTNYIKPDYNSFM